MPIDISEILMPNFLDIIYETTSWCDDLPTFRKFWQENEEFYPHIIYVPWAEGKAEPSALTEWLKEHGANTIDGSTIVCVHLDIRNGVRRMYRFRHENDAIAFKLMFG